MRRPYAVAVVVAVPLWLGACRGSEDRAMRDRAVGAIEGYDRTLIFSVLRVVGAGAVADSLHTAVSGSDEQADVATALRWMAQLELVTLDPLPAGDTAWSSPDGTPSADSLVQRAARHLRDSRRQLEEARDVAARDLEAFRAIIGQGGQAASLSQLRSNPDVVKSLAASLRQLTVLLVTTTRENDEIRTSLKPGSGAS